MRASEAVRAPLAIPPIRFFSSAPGAARARRPTDAVLLVASLVAIGLTTIWPDDSELSRAIGSFVEAIPGLFGWFWELVYDAAFVWAIVLVVAALAGRRAGLVRDQAIAAVLTLAVASLVADGTGAMLEG